MKRAGMTLEDTISMEGVGTLHLCSDVDLYEAVISWVGNDAKLYIEADDAAAMDEAMRSAKVLLENQEEWDRRARECAARCCLDNANDWIDQAVDEDGLDKDEIEYLTEEQFIERIQLQSVNPYPDGSVKLYYEDGGIFLGHFILVDATMKDGPIEGGMV